MGASIHATVPAGPLFSTFIAAVMVMA